MDLSEACKFDWSLKCLSVFWKCITKSDDFTSTLYSQRGTLDVLVADELGDLSLKRTKLGLELVWISVDEGKDGLQSPQMGLTRGLVEKFDQFWRDPAKTLQIDSTGFISRHDSECSESRFSSELQLHPLSINLNDFINVPLWQHLVTYLDKLRHSNNTTKLNLLINITSLQLRHNSRVHTQNRLSMAFVQVAFNILKLENKLANNSQGIWDNSLLAILKSLVQETSNTDSLFLGSEGRLLWISVSEGSFHDG